MKIVVISDIHGNLEALTSLRETYDELWVLGDLVNYGPNPGEAVDFVRANASLVVRGNHDHALGFDEDARCSAPFREMAEAMKEYTASVLSPAQKTFLRELPLRIEREIDGVRFSCCHASPADPLFAYCPPDSPQWKEEIEGLEAETLLVGHTHLPFVRRMGGKSVVNPGSLGQPKTGSPAACCAVLSEGTVELRTFDYPFEQTIQKIERLPIRAAVKAALAAVLRNGGLPTVSRT
jgi:protein phosphatase